MTILAVREMPGSGKPDELLAAAGIDAAAIAKAAKELVVVRSATRPKESVMAKVVNCPCGETVRGETDDELVANVEAHVRSDHPEMVGKMTREDVLGMAVEG